MNTDQPAPAQKPRPSFRKRLAVLLFVGGGSLLQQLEAPYVTANRALFDEMAATGAALDEFFILPGKGRNHYNERGNRAVLPAIIRGLNKDYDVPGQERDLFNETLRPVDDRCGPYGRSPAEPEHSSAPAIIERDRSLPGFPSFAVGCDTGRSC